MARHRRCLLALGCLGGLGLGHLSAWAASSLIEGRTGLAIATAIDGGNIALVAGLMLLASLVAAVPALLVFRGPVTQSLRDGDSAQLTVSAVSECTTSGGEAKQCPTRARQDLKSSELRKSTV